MKPFDHEYYLKRLEAELALAREADNVLVAEIHAELAKQYEIRVIQGSIQKLRLVASNEKGEAPPVKLPPIGSIASRKTKGDRTRLIV